jgi:DNA-binding transcriptional MocR family regulator
MNSSLYRKKGRSDKAARHVRLYHSMMKTMAWKSLSCTARCVYIEIEKRYGGPGSNNGQIHLSVREGAAALKVSKTSVAKALRELQERGFIVAVTRGGFNRKNRHATEWRLTAHASDVSTQFATREFERWEPGQTFGDDVEEQNTVPVHGPKVPSGGQYSPSRRTIAA